MNSKLVSIIITTRNEEDVIGKLIRSVKDQTYRNFEIILVDNNSTDKTTDVAKKLRVKVYNFGPERSAQRNFGAKVSRGEYLLFIDADMTLTEGVVKACVNTVLSDKNIGAVTIPERSQVETFWEKAKGFERSFYNESSDPLTDAARFFPKKIFMKIGGYDENITGPEDWDLSDSIRAKGYEIGRIDKYIYHRERIISLNNLIRKKYYYGLKVHRYLSKQKVSAFSPKTIYFFRPIFYKNFHKFIKHPVLGLGMIVMLTAELLGGGLGYLIGKYKKL